MIKGFDEFLVLNVDTRYNVLLGRSWMHKNIAIPSTYHQGVKYPLRAAQGTIAVDNYPLLNVEAYEDEARFYKVKRKFKADDEGVLVTIPIRHPLAGFHD